MKMRNSDDQNHDTGGELTLLLEAVGGNPEGRWSAEEPADLDEILLATNNDPIVLHNHLTQLVCSHPGYYLRLFGAMCYTVVHDELCIPDSNEVGEGPHANGEGSMLEQDGRAA